MMNNLNSIIRGRETYTISKDMTVLEAARYMAEKQVGAVAVLDGDRVVGVFSERDLMTRVVVTGRAADQTYISEVMTREIVTGKPEESYEEGLRRMQQAKCRHLPIVEDGRLLGFISLRDLLQIEIDEKDEEIKFMNDYIHSVPPVAGH
jgi:CBS domain-containing protein